MKKNCYLTLLLIGIAPLISAKEYHVATTGNDSSNGSASAPLKTISAAAVLAQPGDVVTVHEGIYRERIDPPRGGTSDKKRITYQAAKGEKVVIKGSEIAKGWKQVEGDVWEINISNDAFGDFNPFKDLIHGDWFTSKGRNHHTGAVYLNGHWLTEATSKKNVFKPTSKTPLWFTENKDKTSTTIWAQFKDVDPNKEMVEINARQSVFYPSKTGINYITVSGFTLEQAATPWAPPTAEQIGIIGTNWSKGWIIENNTIQYSTCTGVTLGKHGDEFDNTSANSAGGYVKTINRATARGWTKENIGHHTVKNNHIAHCEQAGIVGSLGAIFSTVTGNHIHHINFRQLFGGAEMSGIKFHAAMDSTIADNHIHHCIRGIWLDWMTEGTRVTRNLLHHNGGNADIFLEVNHGPVVVDNNIMLSPYAMRINSQGAAYAHNLVLGKISITIGERRMTPWLLPHSTKVGGLAPNVAGDEHHYNNLYVNRPNFSGYNKAKLPVWMKGNVFFLGAQPSKHAKAPMLLSKLDPDVKLIQKNNSYYLEMNVDSKWSNNPNSPWVSTELMGKTKTGNKAFLQPDGSPYQRIDTDYFGKKRTGKNPTPGPFSDPKPGKLRVKVWPR